MSVTDKQTDGRTAERTERLEPYSIGKPISIKLRAYIIAFQTF